MASEAAAAPVNGTYAPQQSHFGSTEQGYGAATTNGTGPSSAYAGAGQASSGNASSGSAQPAIPQDEVGWYFVEQYYTTLSRNPEKLFLFYNKRSQFVSGNEEEKVHVCIGQKSINERIKQLDFQDCKVRVNNVDSQGSDQNIVIQVIGEISNKSAPHRKFCQTFVLAEQTNGYFVLNDIFRYLNEDEEVYDGEEPQPAPTGYQEPASTNEPTEPATLTSSTEPAAQEHDAQLLDQGLEKVAKEKGAEEQSPAEPAAADVNGEADAENAAATHAEETPAAVDEEKDEMPTKEAIETGAAEEEAEPEKPQDPVPTPSAAESKPAPAAAPAAPSKPAAPKSWASMAAAAHRVALPNVPSSTGAAPPTTTQSKAAAPSQAASSAAPTPPTGPAAAAPTGPAREESPAQDQSDSAGWQSVGGHEHGKRQSKPAATNEQPNSRAYIKNVYDSLDADALKSELSKYGKLVYFDVSRPKNCAFVDFDTPDAFQAAVAANPHKIGTDTVYVEERRIRPAGQFANRGGPANGPNRGGRGSFEGGRGGQGRGGFRNDGGRGNFGPRGRGGNAGAPRGRGAPQAA